MIDAAVVFHKQLGDTVLLEPALDRIARALGRPPRLVAPAAFAPLLELMPHACQPNTVGCGRPDWSVAFDSGSTSAWASLRLNARHRKLVRISASEKRWHHPWVYHEILDHPGGKTYRALYYWEQAPVDDPGKFRPPRLMAPPESWRPTNLPDRFFLVHPGSAWRRKCWTTQGWKTVIDTTHERTGLPCVITGGGTPWELEHCRDIAAQCAAPVHDVAGRTSLQGFIALGSRAELVLSVDGAAAHFAAAFQRPSVVLFGPTDPCHWHWDGPGRVVLRSQIPTEGRPQDLSGLSAERVVESIAALLEPSGGN